MTSFYKVLITVLVICLIGFVMYKRSAYKLQALLQHETTLTSSNNQLFSNHQVQHLAIIMDGNRRWARSHKLAVWQGHENGIKPVKQAVKFCLEYNVPYLTLYAFSMENFSRPEEELTRLFSIISKGLQEEELQQLLSKDVKIKIVGNSSTFPKSTRQIIENIQEQTKNGTQLTVNILFCYGGRQEITHVTKVIAEKVKAGTLSPDNINDKVVNEHLWTYPAPDPDLVIRTGGKCRLSNFLPWQITYSELLFIDTYWPDITKKDLEEAVEKFTKRTRNFGV